MPFRQLTKALNCTSIILLAFLIISVAGKIQPKLISTAKISGIETIESIEWKYNRDIYFIILDGYARYDVLKRVFGYSNDEFNDELRKRGFKISDKSTSNYAMTALSLASSMSMDYIKSGTDMVGLRRINNNVKDRVIKNGYKYFDEETLARQSGLVEIDFWLLLLRISAIDIIARQLNLYSPAYRRDILRSFAAVEDIALMQELKFVHMRIPAPHSPYVFDAKGNPVNKIKMDVFGDLRLTEWDNKPAYLEQLKYISNRAINMIDVILERSKVRPIIILQSDHGPIISFEGDDLFRVRMGILNAYLVPPDISKQFTNDMSSVNTFRALFNGYFKDKYEILPNRNYHSNTDRPFDIKEVTKILQKYNAN
jgi:hypothetical protein